MIFENLFMELDMKRKEKIELLKRLIKRGEVLCASVCADDWHLEKVFLELIKNN